MWGPPSGVKAGGGFFLEGRIHSPTPLTRFTAQAPCFTDAKVTRWANQFAPPESPRPPAEGRIHSPIPDPGGVAYLSPGSQTRGSASQTHPRPRQGSRTFPAPRPRARAPQSPRPLPGSSFLFYSLTPGLRPGANLRDPSRVKRKPLSNRHRNQFTQPPHPWAINDSRDSPRKGRVD